MTHQEAMERAKVLVSQMTVEEKASQLRYEAPAIERLGVPSYNWWNEALHGVARAGTATVFPQAIGLAATFDTALLGKIADVIATEGRAKYNMQSSHKDRDIYKGLTFWSPNVNIFRDPRWGRGHETYGEDPCLTSRLGVAFVKGLQGTGRYLKGAACAKHYAVHSGPESLRHEFDAIATPKDMAETYLPAFEALVKEADVEAVMGAYNRVNGEPACGSPTLLGDILRKRWGFEGHVVSDCWAIRDFHTRHMVTTTAPESAALALKSGCDVNCGHTYLHLLTALEEGLIDEQDLTVSCERAFASRIRLGLFDTDCSYDAIDYTECDCDDHAALAQTAAEQSMVLLKNDGILPLSLDKVKTIAVIGPNANSRACLLGNYFGTPSRAVTFLEGIRAYVDGHARVLFSEGSALSKNRVENLAQPDDRIAEAVACAELSDVIVACVGLDATLEGEEGDQGNQYFSGDKTDLELPSGQRNLLDALVKTGKPLIVVLAAGSSLRTETGNALLWAGYPGQAGGTALARLLFGEVAPSGHLPITFYHNVDELPDFCDYRMQGHTYRYYEGNVLYPFGFGLTYTTFDFEDATYTADGADVTVTNEGQTDGSVAVQAYWKPVDSQCAPPNASLCAFVKVALKAEETQRIHIPIDPAQLQVVNEDGMRLRDFTQLELYIGAGQPDETSAKVVVVI